jgi:hypothetical protein
VQCGCVTKGNRRGRGGRGADKKKCKKKITGIYTHKPKTYDLLKQLFSGNIPFLDNHPVSLHSKRRLG